MVPTASIKIQLMNIIVLSIYIVVLKMILKSTCGFVLTIEIKYNFLPTYDSTAISFSFKTLLYARCIYRHEYCILFTALYRLNLLPLLKAFMLQTWS